ncbi:prepilin-type N-terminal cleavage/methylation domain-containing protein [Planctomycetota bacterium]|nr:prepilin-type N-terminal cleavage/methylation domain-containing protein [Planctomycetota bacterium]
MHRKGGKAFTLVELLVVIALISLLVTVMVPVAMSLFKGKGLNMAGNNIGGFIAHGRSEAMNSRRPHVLVFYNELTTIKQPNSDLTLDVGPGIVLYRINPNNSSADVPVIEFVNQLNFESAIGGTVEFEPEWWANAEKINIPELGDRANDQFRGFYKVAIRTDGRLVVPGEKNGYMIDTGMTEGLDADVILKDDSDNYIYIDLNQATGAVKSSPVYSAQDLGK